MMLSTAKRNVVAGIEIADRPCPKCKSKMFVIPCKCPQRRRRYVKCAKCINPKCATIVGLAKRGRGK